MNPIGLFFSLLILQWLVEKGYTIKSYAKILLQIQNGLIAFKYFFT